MYQGFGNLLGGGANTFSQSSVGSMGSMGGRNSLLGGLYGNKNESWRQFSCCVKWKT